MAMRKRTEKISLTILPPGKRIAVKPGTVLLNAIRQAGIEIATPCNGQGLCGKCKVRIGDAPPVTSPHPHLSGAEAADGFRLACQVAVNRDMQVMLPADYALDTRVLAGDRIKQCRSAPAARIEKIRGRWCLRYRQRSPVPLETWKPAYRARGIAVDLGTTTVVLTLMDLGTGTELATASVVNPQTRFGHDVISRIYKASTPQGLAELAALISEAINALVREVCRDSGIQPDEILDVVIGGNTTMLQIAAAIDPAPLGRVPFTVDTPSGRTVPVRRFNFKLNPRARVYIPPVAHAFVGADISAGLLAVDFFEQTSSVLFVDMGTNGELALIADGRAMVTSTAAGPAFEGMGITCGMQAATGAIEKIWSNGEFLNLRTVGNAPAKGICGSGIMDVMACLLRAGAVDPDGRLRNPHQETVPANPLSARYNTVDGVAAIQLTDTVFFTQKDIRQFQLAKSAITTGVALLLAAADTTPDRLAKIVIAGAFGHHLSQESVRRIGIIPQGFRGEIVFAGNTCRTGCALLLVDRDTRDYLHAKMKTVTHLSIAEAPDFQSRFIENLAFKSSG